MLSIKQGGIKNHFLSFWYDLTWYWALVSRTIGEHSACYVNEAILQTKEANPVSSTRRVSGELGISLSSGIRHFHKPLQNIWKGQIGLMLQKQCKTFDSLS